MIPSPQKTLANFFLIIVATLSFIQTNALALGCFCNILKEACEQNYPTVASYLYATATTAQRSCLCNDDFDVDCAANIVITTASSSAGPVLPHCSCNEQLTKIVTTALLSSSDPMVMQTLITELAQQSCCDLLVNVLMNLAQQRASSKTFSTVLAIALNSTCNQDIICPLFTNLLRSPLLGLKKTGVLLARLLADDDPAVATLGNIIITTLCCTCSDNTSTIDFSFLITKTLITLSTLFNKPLPRLTCQ